jgi:very-short-patch-repair endonuclease
MTLYFNRQEMKQRRKQLRNNATITEQTLWELLRKRRIEGTKFRRQFSLGAYVLDFYCPEMRLAIEIDGSIHDREDICKKDHIRQVAIEQLKIKMLRFTNREIENDINNVKVKIRNTIQLIIVQNQQNIAAFPLTNNIC